MRHRHRRRALRRHAVDLGGVAFGHLGLAAAQPDTAHREAREALGLGDARLLQQREGRAARAQEDIVGVDRPLLAGGLVLDLDAPAAARQAVQMGHRLREMDREFVLAFEVAQQVGGELAVVHVGAAHDAGGGDGLLGIAALHDQRRPLGDPGVVLGILHAVIAVMGAHRGVALLEEGLAIGADHEAHVRHGMDEIVGRGDGALLDQVRPELARHVELDVDLERLGDVDAAVGAHRRVVQLAVGGMAGAGVVPGGRTLLRFARHLLDHLEPEVGLQLLQEHAQGGAHDAGADQHHVDLLVAHGFTSVALKGTCAPCASTT